MGYTSTFSKRTLPTSRQDDTYYCGVIIWNTVEARIFSDAKWISGSKDAHRASYAVRLLEASDESDFLLVPVSHSFNSQYMYIKAVVCL